MQYIAQLPCTIENNMLNLRKNAIYCLWTIEL